MSKGNNAVIRLFIRLFGKELEVHLCRSLHGILDKLEIGIATGGRHLVGQGLHNIGQIPVILNTLLYIIGRPALDGTEDVPVRPIRFLHPSASHVLRLAVESQLIMLNHHRCNRVCQFLPKLAFEESLQLLAAIRPSTQSLPCHVQEILNQILRRLYVSHIKYPHLLDTALIGFCQLLSHQEGGESTQPKIIMGSSPIGHMVVKPITSSAHLLHRVREMTDIAIIIIRPHQGYIIRNLKS